MYCTREYSIKFIYILFDNIVLRIIFFCRYTMFDHSKATCLNLYLDLLTFLKHLYIPTYVLNNTYYKKWYSFKKIISLYRHSTQIKVSENMT